MEFGLKSIVCGSTPTLPPKFGGSGLGSRTEVTTGAKTVGFRL